MRFKIEERHDQPDRDATQTDILAAAKRLHRSYGITAWERLRFATDFAFGAEIPERACWQFPTGDLTVGQLLDFFSDHMADPPSDLWDFWWYDSEPSPRAFITIREPSMAEEFAKRFKLPMRNRTMGEPTESDIFSW